MTAWSRTLFGASLVLGMGGVMLAEQLPQWWGPMSVLVMVLAASFFLTCSVIEYRRGQAAVGASE